MITVCFRRGLPPNVRYWLDPVRKAVQRRWDEVVRKWPQAVFTRRGRYEVVDGVLECEGMDSIRVAVHLWLDPGEGPGSLYSWGGWAQAVGSESELRKFAWTAMGRQPGLDKVAISGRPPARILITKLSSQIVFSGSDEYPQVCQPG